MKKMMIMAATAILGFAVSAATVNWDATTSWIANDDLSEGGDYNGFSVYFFDGKVTSASTLGAELAKCTFDGAFADKLGNSTISDDQFSFSGEGLSVVGGDATTGVGGESAGFVLIVDKLGEGGHFAMYDFGSYTIEDAVAKGDPLKLAADEIYLGDVSGWSTMSGGADTPEPTSGLLLLLGVAGLALKRRRA